MWREERIRLDDFRSDGALHRRFDFGFCSGGYTFSAGRVQKRRVSLRFVFRKKKGGGSGRWGDGGKWREGEKG